MRFAHIISRQRESGFFARAGRNMIQGCISGQRSGRQLGVWIIVIVIAGRDVR